MNKPIFEGRPSIKAKVMSTCAVCKLSRNHNRFPIDRTQPGNTSDICYRCVARAKVEKVDENATLARLAEHVSAIMSAIIRMETAMHQIERQQEILLTPTPHLPTIRS